MVLLFLLSINPSRFPNASGYIHKDSTVIIQHQDGKIEKIRYLKIEILNDRGKDKLGDITERYDASSQKFVIDFAKTTLPDGSVFNPEKDAISDVSAPEVGFATIYTDMMMKAVSFPALRPGAIIEYRYRIEPKKESKHPLFGKVLFRGTEPMGEKIFTIVVPRNRPLHYSFENGEIPVRVDTTETNLIYTFKKKDIPMFLEEMDMPSISKLAPAILFSQFESMDDMGEWLYEKFSPAFSSDKVIKKKVEELRGNTDEETVLNIARFVQKDVRNVSLYLWDAGYKPHKADVVLKNMYGDPRDKAVLLYSLLKTAGFDPEMILVSAPKGKYFAIVGLSSVLKGDEKVYSPAEFTDIVIKVNLNGKDYYFPVMENRSRCGYLPGRYQGEKGFVVSEKGGYVTLPVLPSGESISRVNMTGEVDKDGNLKCEMQLFLTGEFGRYARWALRDRKKREREIYMESAISSLSRGSTVEYEFSGLEDVLNDVKGTVMFTAPGYCKKEGKEVTFVIPHPPFWFADFGNPAQTSRRRYPVDIGAPGKVVYSFRIKLPVNAKIEFLPEDVNVENEVGSIRKNIKRDGDDVVYNVELIVKKKIIQPEEYRSLRKLLLKYRSKNTRIVIFGNGG